MSRDYTTRVILITLFLIFFIIWVPLVACGGQGLVDQANQWLYQPAGNEYILLNVESNLNGYSLVTAAYLAAHCHGWISTQTLLVWTRCMQASWAFLAFMLIIMILMPALTAHKRTIIDMQWINIKNINYIKDKNIDVAKDADTTGDKLNL